MSEFLEKLEQPELIVASTAQIISVEASVDSEAANSQVTSRDDIGIAVPSADVEMPAEIQPKGLPVPDLLFASAAKSNDVKENLNSSIRKTKGLVRHRAITGCCMTLSLAVLSLAAFDLRGLIDKEGTLDSNLKFTPIEKKKNELPLHFRYFDSAAAASEGMRKISDNSTDAVGFVDENANVVLPAIYSSAEDFHDGLAAVKFRQKDMKTGDDIRTQQLKWGFINKQGETVLPAAYYDVGHFNKGVAPVAIEGHGVLINKKGETIATSNSSGAPQQFGDLYEMSGKDYKRGLMDATGQFVVPPIYDRIEQLNHTETVARGPHYRNYRNKFVSSNEYFKVFQNGKCGLIDNTGELLIPIQYEEIGSFSKGHAVVKRNFRWGLVDAHNNFIIEPNYDFVSIYDDIIATKTHQGVWKVFDSNGKLLNTKIDGAMVDTTSPWLWDGMAAVVIGDKCGFLNNKGDIAIKPDYDLVQHFSNGTGLVMQNGIWKFINKNGTVASPLTFSEAAPFAQGKAAVTKAGPLFEFINLSQIENRKYDYERNRSDAKAGAGHI